MASNGDDKIKTGDISANDNTSENCLNKAETVENENQTIVQKRQKSADLPMKTNDKIAATEIKVSSDDVIGNGEVVGDSISGSKSAHQNKTESTTAVNKEKWTTGPVTLEVTDQKEQQNNKTSTTNNECFVTSTSMTLQVVTV